MTMHRPATWTEGRPIRDSRGHTLLPLIDVGDVASPAAYAWIESARHEFSSIASFGCVARSLIALGAPDDLVERAHAAADDERHHTKICLDIAKQHGAPDARLTGDINELMSTRKRPDDLTRTAQSALLDGVLDEGFAAGRLRRTAHHARASGTTELANALERLADDERRHADLARDIVRWCVSVRPWIVDDLVVALDDIGDTRPESPLVELVDADERSMHGLCTDADADAAWVDAVGSAHSLVASVSDQRARISS